MAISNNSTGLRPGVCTSTTRPTAPYEGQMIFETDTDMVAIWNGTAWRYISATTPTNGTVLQIQQTVKNDTTSTTSATFADISGMSVSITPKSSSSKILVEVCANVGFGASPDDVAFRVLRDATAVGIGTGGSTYNATFFVRGNSYSNLTLNIVNNYYSFLDSPSTTSATTYKIQWYTRTSEIFLNRRGADSSFVVPSSITVKEIAG
jgi:hypothetical protein